MWSRPSGATMCKQWVEQLGGAPAGAQGYWQGRFAACAFVGGFLGSSHPRNSWGVAPNPTRDRRKGTKSPLDPARGRRKGTKSPLDPFSRLSWSRFHAPSACSYLVLRLSPCLLPQLSVKNPKIARTRSNPPCGLCCVWKSVTRQNRPLRLPQSAPSPHPPRRFHSAA